MKYFRLTILFVLTIANNVFSQKIDTTRISDKKGDLNVKRRDNRGIDSLENINLVTHGVYATALTYPYYSTIGYEYTHIRNRNTLGLDIATAFFNVYNNAPSGRKYLNLFLGFAPFYEYGKHWGFRIGFQLGASVNPITYTNKMINIVPQDRPDMFELTNSLSMGVFLRTKNYRWQFTLSATSGYFIGLRKGISNISLWKPELEKNTYKYWATGFYAIPLPSLTVKYNFKISKNNNR